MSDKLLAFTSDGLHILIVDDNHGLMQSYLFWYC